MHPAKHLATALLAWPITWLIACESPLPPWQGADAGADRTKDPGDDEPVETADGQCPSLEPWVASGAYPASSGSHPLPSFALGGYYYVHANREGAVGRMYSARIEDDGSLGAWQVATDDHGGGRDGFAAVTVGDEAYHFRNGHIARYPLAGDGRMIGDVELLEDGMDTSFGGNRYAWDSAVVATVGGETHVFHLGGFSYADESVHREIYHRQPPLRDAFQPTGKLHPAEFPGKAVFVSAGQGGYLFTADAAATRLWRAEVLASGELGEWSEVAAPAASGRGDLFALGSMLFAVRGSSVWSASVDSDGNLGAYRAMPSLPSSQVADSWENEAGEYVEAAAYAVVDDRVYLTGADRVYHSQIAVGACE